MMRFNADMFRAAMMCVSSEEVRYYLKGVLVEPHPAGEGVLLVATNGHSMLVVHDATGEADQAGIVILSAEAQKSCKSGKFAQRLVTIDGNTAKVVEPEGDGFRTVAISEKCFIDGTFPDWRRVIPDVTQATSAGMYAAGCLVTFAKIAGVLSDARKPTLRIASNDAGSPALVQFGDVPHAFGVLMPVRGDMAFGLPTWLEATKTKAA